MKAIECVEAEQSRQNYYVTCIEEIVYRRGFVDAVHLMRPRWTLKRTDYGRYLMSVARGGLKGTEA